MDDGGIAQQQQNPWDLTKGNLSKLLTLSRRLNLDGEVTPVMIWGMLLEHPRLAELRLEDFERLAEELRGKVRCYGCDFPNTSPVPPSLTY